MNAGEPTRSGGFRSVVFLNRQPGTCGPLIILLILLTGFSASADPVTIGSKKFTESYVLAESPN